MITLAENHCYGALERALELKAQKENRQIGQGLKRRLDDAIKWGWLTESDFDAQGAGGTVSMLEVLRRLRNNLAHGKTHLFPTGTLGMIQLCGVIISKLFPNDSAQ